MAEYMTRESFFSKLQYLSRVVGHWVNVHGHQGSRLFDNGRLSSHKAQGTGLPKLFTQPTAATAGIPTAAAWVPTMPGIEAATPVAAIGADAKAVAPKAAGNAGAATAVCP